MKQKRPRQREVQMRKLLEIFFHWEVRRFAEETDMSDDWLNKENFLSWIGMPLALKLEEKCGTSARSKREIVRITDLVGMFAERAFGAFEKERREGEVWRAAHFPERPNQSK